MNIDAFIPQPRLERYRIAAGPNTGDIERFYRWCQQLALALFADIAALEVTMRSAMARELTAVYGVNWYVRHDIFDDDAARSIAQAWRQNGLSSLRDAGVDNHVLEGKLVAGLSFGFWVQILGRGSHFGKQPMRQRRIYDQLLWQPALSRAFPAAPSRRDTEHAASTVRAARNRIAHHEHVAWGIPLPGQGTRLDVLTVRDRMLTLAGWVAPGAQEWIAATSSVEATVDACPIDERHLHLRPPTGR